MTNPSNETLTEKQALTAGTRITSETRTASAATKNVPLATSTNTPTIPLTATRRTMKEPFYEGFKQKKVTLQPESLFLGVCLGVIIATCLILLAV